MAQRKADIGLDKYEKKKEKVFPTKGNKIIVYKTNNPIAEDEILEQFVFTDDGLLTRCLIANYLDKSAKNATHIF